MRTVTTIYCRCGEPCGKEYPPRFSNLDGGEPSFSEGIGENFEWNDEWFCSEACREKAIKEEAL